MALRPLAPFDLPEEDDQPDQPPQVQADLTDEQPGDVLDTLAPRRTIDTSRGNPLNYRGDMRKWFASEVQSAEKAQAHNDVLDRMTARSAESLRQKTAAQADRDAKAAAKSEAMQTKRDTNNRVEKDLRSRGAEMYTDANGNIQPDTDEEGRQKFIPEKGETQYDEKGAFRVDRTRLNPKVRVDLDADAPIGHADGDLGNLYKQNKHTDWTHVATVEEGLNSTDPAIKEAALKANDAAQKHQHAAAKEALVMEENEVSAKENAANAEFQGRAQKAMELQKQVDGLRANPGYNQTEGGAIFGIGRKPAPGAQQLRDQEKALNAQIGELTANPPDPKVFAAQKHAAMTRAHAFDYLFAKHGGMDGALDEWGTQLKQQGQDPSADPVVQSVNKARVRAGLAPIAGTTAPAMTDPEPPAPAPSESAEVNEIQAVSQDIHARIAPVKQRLVENSRQIRDAQAQAGEHAKTLKALGIGADNNGIPLDLWERSAVPRAGLQAAQSKIKSLAEQQAADIREHDVIAAEHAALIGDEKNPGELMKKAQEADAQAAAPAILARTLAIGRGLATQVAGAGALMPDGSTMIFKTDLEEKHDRAVADATAGKKHYAVRYGKSLSEVPDSAVGAIIGGTSTAPKGEARFELKPGEQWEGLREMHRDGIIKQPSKEQLDAALAQDTVFEKLKVAASAKESRIFINVTDLPAAAMRSIQRGLLSIPAGVAGAWVGLKSPDDYPEWARRDIAVGRALQARWQKEDFEQLLAGKSSSVTAAVQEAGPSLAFSAISMGASIGVGAAAGSAVPVAGTATGAVVGVLAELGGSGLAAYRMAGSQFLSDAFAELEEESQEKRGKPLTKEEKAEWYRKLLPLAQHTGKWEAIPEAVGNVFTLGAGKLLFGTGGRLAKNQFLKKLADRAIGKAVIVVGDAIVEVGTEGITEIGQDEDQRKLAALLAGQPIENIKADWSTEGIVRALEKVTPQTLAMLGIMGGGGLAYKGARKVSSTAKNIYKDKATVQGAADNVQMNRALSPDMLESLGAISEPSPEAAALGAKPIADQKTALGEADAKIEGLRSELDGATGITKVNKRAEIAAQIDAAVQERQGIVQKVRAFNAAAAEIEGIAPETHESLTAATPEQIESTKIAARALVKISQGAPMDSLTAVERAAVEHPETADGLPRVEMVKGGDGNEHPVITDGAIQRLAAVAPAAASLIGKNETERRAEIIGKSKETETAKPAESATAPAAEEQATGTTGEAEPMRALSEDEEKRTRAFRSMLTNQGVPGELADRVARGYVSKHGIKGAPAQHREAVVKALAAAGGHTFATEPNAAKRSAANTAALAGIAATDAKVSTPLHEQRANQFADTFAAAMDKVGWATDPKTGKVVFGKEHATGLTAHKRTEAKAAIRNLAKAIAKYFHDLPIAVQVGTAPGIKLDEGQPGTGGGWLSDNGVITFSVHDVLTDINLGELANPERAELVVQEEAIHALVNKLLGREEAAKLFADVKREAPKFAELVARTYGSRNDYVLGHELIRYRVQEILQGKVNEETSPGVLDSKAFDEYGKVVGLVRVFLGKLLAAIKNFVSHLKKQGASKETIDAVENVAQAVAKKIRENAADARRLDPYGVAYDARGATDTTAEEDAGAEESAGGGGVGAPHGGSTVQPGGNATASGNQGGGGAVQKGTGSGGVPGHDADSAATRQELAKVRAELDARKEKEEAARGRRNAAIAHSANRLSDFQEVLAKVPADKRADAEALLNRAILGASTYVLGVNQTRYPAAYLAAAPGLVQTSHLPEQHFAKNPAYGGSNTRKYESDEAEQNKVRGISLNIDPPQTVINGKSAADGPPQVALVIGADGNVTLQTAGGNGREMGFNLASHEDQQLLADEWQANAAAFGFRELPDGFRGYRFLGVYDLRNTAEAKSYQSLVDALNPSPGVVAGAGQRAEIDARTKIDPAALSGLSLDLSTSQAVEKLNEFLRNAEKLGLDRNLMTAIASDAPNAQLYIQKLILAGAFHSPAISQFYFDSQSVSGGATAKGLVKAAASAAIELRKKGGAEFAEAIGRTLAEVISYTKAGQGIASAIGNAAQQAQTGTEGRIVQAIATALENKVEFREQNKSGNRPVNTEATIENFNELFSDIARAVGNFSSEPDLLGETDTLDATLARAFAANARRTQEYQTPVVAARTVTFSEAVEKRKEIIADIGDSNDFELHREIAGFGQPPTEADIYTEDDDDLQHETALWKNRYGRAAGYSVSRMRKKDDAGKWGEWEKWKGYKPDSDSADEEFTTATEAIQWLRTAPLEDAGQEITDANTDLSRERKEAAVNELLEAIGLPEGWELDRATDSQYGSKYWNVTAFDGTPFKLSVRSHEPSEKWQRELGRVDYYAPLAWEKGDAINHSSLQDISDAMESVEDWMRRKDIVLRKKSQSAPPVASRPAQIKDTRRLRELLNQQREEGLNRWEQAELETLEKKAGQDFMQFYGETKQEPKFSLESESQRAGGSAGDEQLALLSRTGAQREVSQLRDVLHETAEIARAETPAEFTEAAREGRPYPGLPGYRVHTGLSADERAVEAHFAYLLTKMPGNGLNQYIAMARKAEGHDGYLGADLARELYPAYAKNPRLRLALDRATISPTGWLMMNKVWPRILRREGNEVILVAGGMASGKTTAAKTLLGAQVDDAAGVAERIYGNYDQIRQAVEEVNAAGKTPVVVFTFRPYENAVEGAILRTIKSGRPVYEMGWYHLQAQKAFLRAARELSGKAVFKVLFNDGGMREMRPGSVDELASRTYGESGDESRNHQQGTGEALQGEKGNIEDDGSGMGRAHPPLQRGVKEAGSQQSLVVPPAPLRLSGTEAERIAQLEAYWREAIDSARDNGIRVQDEGGTIRTHKIDGAQHLAMTQGHLGEDGGEVPMARTGTRNDPNQIDVAGIVPAIRIAGTVFAGQKGDTHKDILDRHLAEHPDDAEAIANFDTKDNPNFFITADGAELSSAELNQKFGVSDSQGLAELQAGEEISKSTLSEEAVQGYLSFENVPSEKQPKAKKAIAKASATKGGKYPLPAAGGMDRDIAGQRERQAAVYRGLAAGDAAAVKQGIAEGVPLSSLMLQFIRRDIPSFDIRGAVIRKPEDVAAFMAMHRTPFFESSKILVLDGNMQVIHSQILASGALNETFMGQREVTGIIEQTRRLHPDVPLAGFILSHNHPSGDPAPSTADERMTRILDETGKLIGVPLLDHVITNGRSHFSFREMGVISGASKVKEDGALRLPSINANQGEPGLADWEAIGAGAGRISLQQSGETLAVIRTLKTADPDHLHILITDTKLKLIAVNRYPTNADMGMIARETAATGAYGVILSSPQSISAPVGSQLSAFESRLILKFRDAMKAVGVRPVDAFTAGGYSAAQSGQLMEDSPVVVAARAPSPSAPFYSQLTKTVQNLPQETMTVGQARAAIQKGAKPDEVNMSGILTDPLSPLNGKQPGDKVTKAELTGYALERQATVQDVVLGAPVTTVPKGWRIKREIYSNGEASGSWIAVNRKGEIHVRAKSEEETRAKLLENLNHPALSGDQGAAAPTHFSSYQLPGADEGSYREMFVTWPESALTTPYKAIPYNGAWAVRFPDNFILDGFPTKEAALASQKKQKDSGMWRDGHAAYEGIANPIVRIRRNIRTGAEGRKTYFIEEIQGPGKGEQEKMPPELRKRIYEIGMKRALRDAVDEGADAIAWTTGEQQAERYSLEKQVEEVKAFRREDGAFDFSVKPNGESAYRDIDAVPESKLEDHIGKELSARVAAQPDGWQTYSGLDLKVGGEGLKRLYDVTLSGIANDLAKKFGVKAGKTQLASEANAKQPEIWNRADNLWEVAYDGPAGENIAKVFRTEGEAREHLKSVADGPTVHSLAIPEALRTQQREQGNAVMARAGTGNVSELVTENLGLAYTIADRFDNTLGSDKEERRSIARQALVKAARSYDPAKGEFAAYAGTSVRNAMRDHFHRQGDYAHRNLTTLDAPMEEGGEDTFKDEIPAAGPTSAANAQMDEMKKAVRAAIDELPQGLREVVEGIAAGDTMEAIGQRQGGLTKQGIARKAQVAMERMRHALKRAGVSRVDDILSPAARPPGNVERDDSEGGGFEEEVIRLINFARAEKPGERTIGRPDLALGALDPIVMGVDEARKGVAKKQTHKEWEAASQNIGRDQVRAVFDAGGTLGPDETKAAMRFVIQDVKAWAANPDDTDLEMRVARFVNSYRDTGTNVARMMAARQDPTMSRADRYREFLAAAIFSPKDVQKKLDEAKTPKERDQILSEDGKRLARLKAKLAEQGITFDDIFNDETDFRLKAREIAKNEIGAAKGRDADILKAFMERRNFPAVAREMKVPEAEVRRVVEAAKQRVIARHKEKFQQGATRGNVVAARAPVAGWENELNYLLDAIGLTEESPAEAKKREIRKRRKGRPFNINDPVDVYRLAAELRLDQGTKIGDVLMEFWIANILSGPQTQTANIAGNLGGILWDTTFQRGAEAIYNIFRKDPKAAQLGEILPMLGNVFKSKTWRNSWKLAASAWTAEYDFTDHMLGGKMIDLNETGARVAHNQAVPGWIGRNIVRIPFRILGFFDSFFKSFVAHMEVSAQAYRLAKAEKLSGKAFDNRMLELTDTLGSPAWVAAVEKSRELTFQQELKSTETAREEGTYIPGLSQFEDIARSVSKMNNPLVKLVAPFIPTPYNILRTGLRKTPLGAIPLTYDVLRTAFAKVRWIIRRNNGKIEVNPSLSPTHVRDMAEQGIAFLALMILWGAFQGDGDDDNKMFLITGSSPYTAEGRGERELQERATGGSYVIRIGGRKGFTFHYGRYEPFATVIGTLADSVRAYKLRGATADGADAMMNYLVAQMQSKSFLQGVADLTRNLQASDKWTDKAARTLAQAIVPNIIRQPARAMDDYARDTKHADFLYSMLPVAGNAEPAINVWGKEKEKAGSPLARLLFPAPMKPEAELHPADQMLIKWNEQNPSKSWAPDKAGDKYKTKPNTPEIKMTGEQYREYSQRRGQLAERLLAGKITARMIAAPKESDVKIVRDAFEKAGHDAREQMFNRRPLASLIWE